MKLSLRIGSVSLDDSGCCMSLDDGGSYASSLAERVVVVDAPADTFPVAEFDREGLADQTVLLAVEAAIEAALLRPQVEVDAEVDVRGGSA